MVHPKGVNSVNHEFSERMKKDLYRPEFKTITKMQRARFELALMAVCGFQGGVTVIRLLTFSKTALPALA
jgi:hypothetical protein